jgi:CubicO group peptidase (beta-lactamase class C family)
MLVLNLVDEGKWNLDEALYKYWLDLDIANDSRVKKITTRFILSHRSGFPNWQEGKLTFQYEPGSKYQYSGEGFEYLRKALEIKFHKTLDQLVGELIFKPLKMNDTKFFGGRGIDQKRFAKPHDKEGHLYNDVTTKNKSASAAYGVLTTVEDYSKFLIYLMNGAGIKKKLFDEMVYNQTQIKPHQYFGLCWMVDEIDGENLITHGGVEKGTQTIVFMLPKSKQGLVIFTNCGNGGDAYISVIQNFLGQEGQAIINVETK